MLIVYKEIIIIVLMKILVDLQFGIPIWRVFYGDDETPKIPFEFKYKNKLYSNGITILQIGMYVSEEHFHNHFFNNLTCSSPIICAPNIEIYNLFKKYRPQYEVILANHNAFINENFYKITNEEKKYDIVINSSFTYLKRLHLSNKIKNKAFIGYKCNSVEEFNSCVPKDGFIANFEDRERNLDNWKWVNNIEVLRLYNQSKVGCIFSPHEGACFSSSEYLLCGLPVVSTQCIGGREIWYNNENSIICEPTEDSVELCVNNAIMKLQTNEFNPENIRNNHIELMNVHRHTLTNKVLELYKKISNDIPDYNTLFDSLKHYHTNNYAGYPGTCIIQTNKEIDALTIIKKI
jgi:glycosyltransferase involved in cell wall biosynthesis